MKNFINENILITEFKFSIYVEADKGLKSLKKRRSDGFIYNCGENKKYVFSDGTKLLCQTGDVIFVPKNSSYRIESLKTGNCFIINFETNAKENFAPFVFTPKNPLEILTHFDNAENMWRNKMTGYYEKCLSELYNIIYYLKKSITTQYVPKNKQKLINPAVSYIHDNFTNENISIEKLAELCNISEQYLRRIFADTYATSPLKYINNLKMLRAKELIRSGVYSVGEAAELSGFSDYSYFSREFKKSTGVSPTDYEMSVEKTKN